MSKKSDNKIPPQRDPELEIEDLQDQLELLKALPGDFRDLPIGSREWKLFKRVMPEREESMDIWAKGPIMVCGDPLSPIEKEIIERNHKSVQTMNIPPSQLTLQKLVDLVNIAENSGISFIYMKGFPNTVTVSINYLASFFKLHVRAKHEYTESKQP